MEKELPKLEKQLKAVLLQWEEDHERYFVVNDTRYLDTMEYQMMERSQEREQEKMKKVILLTCVVQYGKHITMCATRHALHIVFLPSFLPLSNIFLPPSPPFAMQKRDKEETLRFEMTYGSKPCTPIKR